MIYYTPLSDGNLHATAAHPRHLHVLSHENAGTWPNPPAQHMTIPCQPYGVRWDVNNHVVRCIFCSSRKHSLHFILLPHQFLSPLFLAAYLRL